MSINQISHLFAGMALSLALGRFLPVLTSILVVTGFSFGKEALEARGWALWGPWGVRQDCPGAITDFAHFCVGITIAAVILLIPR